MKANLCKCNNCDSVLIDDNPQTNAILHTLKGDEMTMVEVIDENGVGFVCPICLVDDYLIDL